MRSTDSPTSSSHEESEPTGGVREFVAFPEENAAAMAFARRVGLLLAWVALLGDVVYHLVVAAQRGEVGREWHLMRTQSYENATAFALAMTMTFLTPLITASLLLPAMERSAPVPWLKGVKLPAWPFLLASVPLGAVALLPFLALWQPPTLPERLPPPPRMLRSNAFLRLSETPALAYLLYFTIPFLVLLVVTPGPGTWRDALHLALGAWGGSSGLGGSSGYVHLSAVHFLLLNALLPFLVLHDAERRRFDMPGWLRLVMVFPILGPAVYLMMRPRAYGPLQRGATQVTVPPAAADKAEEEDAE